IPHLPDLTTEPSEKEKVEMITPPPTAIIPPQNAKAPSSPSPSPSPSSTVAAATAPTHSTIISESMATSLHTPMLEAYDISYWIKKGSNRIVATVRNDQGPASFLATGFMVRRDGALSEFETNAEWLVGEQQKSAKQHAVETGANGSSPWGYLTQDLGNRINLSDLDTIVKPVAAILLTTVGILAL